MQKHIKKTIESDDDIFDLKELIIALLARKFLIISLTSFVTIFAILYVFSQSPSYQATTSFTLAPSSSITNLNQAKYTRITKKTLFTDFLTQLSSKTLHEKVFIENNFLTIFNKDQEKIDDIDKFIKKTLGSVKLIRPDVNKTDMLIYLNENPYALSMSGSDPVAISSYLDTLVLNANSKTIMELVKLNQQKVDIRLDQILLEIKMLNTTAKQERMNQITRLKEEDDQKIKEINGRMDSVRYKEKQARLNRIVTLNEFATIANSMGIIENNFYNNKTSQQDFTIAIGEVKDLPPWYLYGEKALLEQITILENRTNDDPFILELIDLNNQLDQVKNNTLLSTLENRQDDSPFIPELVSLNIEKNALESTKNLLTDDLKSINVIKFSEVENISRSKIGFVLFAFFISFLMSIFLAIITNALWRNEEISN